MNVLVFNIKALSKINSVSENNSVIRYYRSPNLDMLRNNTIRETNILEKLKNFPKKTKKKRVVEFVSLNKKKNLLEKILKIRAIRYENRVKSQIHAGNI